MTDEEVQGWLSDDERRAWRIDIDANLVINNSAILRSLAETRKALGRVEGYAYDRISECCVLCGYNYPPHAPTCIFTTMPRP